MRFVLLFGLSLPVERKVEYEEYIVTRTQVQSVENRNDCLLHASTITVTVIDLLNY